ncbi:MAG: hypothetical protein ACKO8Q_10030, partial [Bacteroidota bacterium]
CGQKAQLKYAQDLYEKKAYADSRDMIKSMKSPTEEAYALQANCEFQLRNMQGAADAYRKAGSGSLSDSDKLRYAESLKSIGESKSANQVIASICNKDQYKEEIDLFLTSAQVKETKIKIEKKIGSAETSESLPFYFNDSLFYISNFIEKYTTKSNFKYDNRPFSQITSNTDSKEELARLNTDVNDGPVSANSYAVIFNRSIASSRKSSSRVSLFEKNIESLSNSKSEELSFCKDSFSYMHPALKGNSNQLVFVSNHNFENNTKSDNFDIYITSKDFLNNGTWETPKSLSKSVNSKYDELFPSFLNDSILIFASARPNGIGGLDIYTSTLGKDGNWAAPRLMPEPLNSSFDDFHLIADKKEKYQYFISSNREGSDDIYQVNLPEDLKGEWKIELIDGKTVQPLINFPISLQTEVSGDATSSLLTNSKGTFDGVQSGGINTVSANFYKTTQITYPKKEHSFFTTTYQTIALLPIEKWLVSGVVTDIKTNATLQEVEVLIEGKTSARTSTNDQ